MSQHHFAKPIESHAPGSSRVSVALVALGALAIAGLCGLLAGAARDADHGWLEILLWALAGFIPVAVVLPRLKALIARADLKGRELTLRAGPIERRVDLSRVSQIQVLPKRVEIRFSNGLWTVQRSRLAVAVDLLRSRRRAVVREAGVRTLSGPQASAWNWNRMALFPALLSAWLAVFVHLLIRHGLQEGMAFAAPVFLVLTTLWALAGRRGPQVWLTPDALHIRSGPRALRVDLAEALWFGWQNIRDGVRVEIHVSSALYQVRCNRTDGAFLCNVIQWKAPKCLQVSLSEGVAQPGPRTREVSEDLAEGIRQRIRSLGNRDMIRRIGNTVLVSLGLLVVAWSIPHGAGRILLPGVLILLGAEGIGLAWTFLGLRKREMSILESLPVGAGGARSARAQA